MDILEYLEEKREKLLHADNWQKISLTRIWTASIPQEAGVYAIKENERIVYVGETGNLQGRMNDLLDSRHHTLRRTIGHNLFSNTEGYVQATTKLKFPLHIEALLNKHICANLSIAYLTLPLGRKELEEFIERQIEQSVRLNKRGKRKTV
jgi:hypothetical protein